MRICVSLKKRKIILLVLCTVLCLVFLTTINFLGNSKTTVLLIKGFPLPIPSLSGIISALTMLLCIFMVFIHYNIGSKIAFFIITFSIFESAMQIFRAHALYSLPGVISPIVSLASISIIYIFYKRSTINSYTDLITKLFNRRKFSEDIKEKISAKKKFCLAYIEIEDFKQLNDIYGIQIADFVLSKVGENLKKYVGKRDGFYKITGATFAVIFDNEKDVENTIRKMIEVQKIILPVQTDEESSDIAHISLINLAAGITRFPFDAENETSLIKKAGIALSSAKKSQTDKFFFYTTTLEESETKQKEAEALIRESLEKEYFYLVYQPQFNIVDKKLRGFETLIRCRKPDGSIISPTFFIPAAEKSNLILKIDDYVLRRAMNEFKPILDEKGDNYIISVNISAKNIGAEDFTDRIKKIIEQTNFPPQCLEIEITEYSLAESLENTIENIQNLRAMGVHVALDDFGTGYTSIAQLMKLPINLLKIDKSLIDNIESNNNIRDLVNSVIYMGHVMNCEVISEGVENEQQIDVLKKHKCDFVQGFVWGKPLSFNDAVNLC